MITLEGGPYHGQFQDDLGHSPIRMSIQRKVSMNARIECGYAHYEPTEDRSTAFWVDNDWPGEWLVEEGTLW